MQTEARFLQPDELRRLRGRDPGALSAAFNAHRVAVEGAARRLGFAPPEAEEVAQSVWATFLEIVPRFEGRSRLRTFLLGILRRKAAEARRHVDRAVTAIPEHLDTLTAVDHENAEAALSRAELGRSVNRCVDGLPATERRAVEMKILQEGTSDEVGRELRVSANYLGVILHRARAHLRDCLGAHFA